MAQRDIRDTVGGGSVGLVLAQVGLQCAQFNSAAPERLRNLAFDGCAYAILLPPVPCPPERVRIYNYRRALLVGRGAARVSLRRKAVFSVRRVNDVTAGFLARYAALPSAFPRQDVVVGRLAVGWWLNSCWRSLGFASEFPFLFAPDGAPFAGKSAPSVVMYQPVGYGQASDWVGAVPSEYQNGLESGASVLMGQGHAGRFDSCFGIINKLEGLLKGGMNHD